MKSYRHLWPKVEAAYRCAFLPPDDLRVLLSDDSDSPCRLVRIVSRGDDRGVAAREISQI
jgi:hypothetical protein